MRRALQSVQDTPDHAGLAYEVWAPVEGDTGKVKDENRPAWLESIERIQVPADYAHAYERWRDSFAHDGSRVLELTLASRMLVGHGNAAPTDVGLTLHRTWGVPVIPGSALKGLLSHYIDAVYGPDQAGKSPKDPSLDDEARERARFQGVTWQEKRIQYGPGAVHGALFGAPEADDRQTGDSAESVARASQGLVVFHDALYVPDDPGEKNKKGSERGPLAADVLTVHQRSYYNDRAAEWPNDYGSPNPVAFLTVRPGARFLLALSGPADWAELAMALLCDALVEWGVGGKTSQGYGRAVREGFRKISPRPRLHRASEDLAAFRAWLETGQLGPDGQPVPQRQTIERIGTEWLDRLVALTPAERQEAAKAIHKHIKSKKLTDQVAQLVAALGADETARSRG